MVRTTPNQELPGNRREELEGSVVILSAVYAVFLLGVIAMNIGWL
ncbi:MAG: hypothetical protein AAF270_07240 [Pseudomonadota bacterium]